jgi:hypothetical protein
MKDRFNDVLYDYTEAVRVRGAVSTSRELFCCALVFHYNKGINSTKRLHWEWRQ